jgi:sporulation protein YlmC with PRC-barrel domain
MRVKHALAATTAALFLTTSGFALAQQTSPGATDPGRAGAPTERVAPSGAGLPAERNSATLAPATLHEIKDNDVMVQSLNISKKDLTGMDIYGSDGKKIGDVDKVLADSSNSVKAVTADVGGFLGIGAREVVIPIDKLQKGPEKDRLQVTMTKDELQKLAKWEDSNARRDPSAAETPRTAPPSTQPSR